MTLQVKDTTQRTDGLDGGVIRRGVFGSVLTVYSTYFIQYSILYFICINIGAIATALV